MTTDQAASVIADLAAILKKDFKVKAELADDSDAMAVGLDSLDIMNYVFRIEEKYQVKIPDEEIVKGGLLVLGKTAAYVLDNRPAA